jgi:hypothetical protein
MVNPAPSTLLISLLAAAGAGACGPKRVQLYEGPALAPDQVTLLYSNKHLDLNVDRTYTLPASDRGKLHLLEIPAGHHAVEVRCLYTDDVPYHAVGGGGSAPAGQKYTVSPPIALLLEGLPGHRYKPRARFERDGAGVPGCHVKMFDITNEPGGASQELY